MSDRSHKRPLPLSPHANLPDCGSTISMPNSFNVPILRCVITFSYIPVFIAGQMILGHDAAKNVVVSISSAIPCASFAITFALAGTTAKTSQRCAIEICFTLRSATLSKVETITLCLVKASKVKGAMNSVAFFVMMTSTS